MALHENIRARRTQLKLSQEYVAEKLGVSRQAVAKWEAGKSEPTAANMARLAALFEMSISGISAKLLCVKLTDESADSVLSFVVIIHNNSLRLIHFFAS